MDSNTTSNFTYFIPSEYGCETTVFLPWYAPSYGYVPSLAPGVVFCVLFGISCIGHIIQTSQKHAWWFYVFAIGAGVEVMGWAARAWSSQCPYNNDAFLMQISTLIIAPTFFTAGIYVILGQFIHILGRQFSIISPRLYLYIFCTCDFISLVIQAIGGGIASGAETVDVRNLGTHIMVAGIVFQLATLTVFCYFFCNFLWRASISHSQLPRNIKLLTYATTFSVVTIYIRSIYRTIELVQGWTGYLITHQQYFIALDGAMMILAVAVYNIFHPATLLANIKSGGGGHQSDPVAMDVSPMEKTRSMQEL